MAAPEENNITSNPGPAVKLPDPFLAHLATKRTHYQQPGHYDELVQYFIQNIPFDIFYNYIDFFQHDESLEMTIVLEYAKQPLRELSIFNEDQIIDIVFDYTYKFGVGQCEYESDYTHLIRFVPTKVLGTHKINTNEMDGLCNGTIEYLSLTNMEHLEITGNVYDWLVIKFPAGDALNVVSSNFSYPLKLLPKSFSELIIRHQELRLDCLEEGSKYIDALILEDVTIPANLSNFSRVTFCELDSIRLVPEEIEMPMLFPPNVQKLRVMNSGFNINLTMLHTLSILTVLRLSNMHLDDWTQVRLPENITILNLTSSNFNGDLSYVTQLRQIYARAVTAEDWSNVRFPVENLEALNLMDSTYFTHGGVDLGYLPEKVHITRSPAGTESVVSHKMRNKFLNAVKHRRNR